MNMGKYILVFSEKDKKKLEDKGLLFVGKQGNSFVFKNSKNVVFENDITMMRTDVIRL